MASSSQPESFEQLMQQYATLIIDSLELGEMSTVQRHFIMTMLLDRIAQTIMATIMREIPADTLRGMMGGGQFDTATTEQKDEFLAQAVEQTPGIFDKIADSLDQLRLSLVHDATWLSQKNK